MTTENGDDESDEVIPSSALSRPASKSPLYEAFNAARYQRQELIRKLESQTGNRVISYTAARGVPIDRDDVMAFVDLLHPIDPGSNIDLVLHTSGGDIDATEKLATMLWSRIGSTGSLRVIVPDVAKSAGTLLALAADSVVMSDSSELGPIDPQRLRQNPDGSRQMIAVQHHLDAFKRHSDAYRADPTDRAAQLMLAKFDPAEVEKFQNTMDRARQLSDKHLKEGMFRRGGVGNYTQITGILLDTKRWLTHSQMIGRSEAEEIGLAIQYFPPDDAVWMTIWRLHCLQRLVVGADGPSKLFESDLVCLQIA